MSVYFITCRKTEMVKIGCAYDPVARLKGLQCANPNKLKIEALMKGSHRREKELHKLLKKYRVRGEWFRLCPEIEAIMKEATRPTRVKSLADKRAMNLDEMAEDRAPEPRFAPIPRGIGFLDPLPPPRVTPAFDERCLSRETRKRIASGDIYFPFRPDADRIEREASAIRKELS